MKVKRYVSRSLQEAMEKIRLEMGKDALILNTKKIRTGGFLGFFKREEFEIIAAVDFDKKSEKSSRPQNSSVERSIPNYQNNNPSIAASTDVPKSSHIEEKKEDPILQEVKEMREMVVQFMNNQTGTNTYPILFNKVLKRLREQEVEESIIQTIIREIIKKRDISNLKEQDVFVLVREEITQILSKHFIGVHNQSTRLFHIVGPTGVGKTTTIAKLAANYMIKHHKKIAFITADTYRIAAIEQLRTYANILNVPIEVVYTPAELQGAIQKLHEYELIIMDTAGRNYRDKHYIQEVSKYLSTSIPSETFIALSLTSKYQDMVEIIRQFEDLNVKKVIFTKLDETSTYGSILNICFNFHLKLSYATNGQAVPDDLFIANPEKIASIILGGEEHA